MLHDHSALEPAEAIQGISQQAENAGGGLLIRDDEIALETAADGPERPQPPIQSPRTIDVYRTGADVFEDAPELPPLKRAQRAQDQIVSEEVAHQKADALSAPV